MENWVPERTEKSEVGLNPKCQSEAVYAIHFSLYLEFAHKYEQKNNHQEALSCYAVGCGKSCRFIPNDSNELSLFPSAAVHVRYILGWRFQCQALFFIMR